MSRETFDRRLARSHLAVWVAASWAWANGRNVRIPSTPDEGPDDGDLFVQDSPGSRWQRLEVKHIRRDWTCREDFPFEKVLICASHSYDRAKPKPSEYVLFNHRMTHVIRVTRNTRPLWWTAEVADRSRDDGHQQCYCIKPSDALFEEVPDDLVVQI